MKIALVQCPAWGRQNPPLALSMLSAYLRSKGREVFNFDLNNKLFNHVEEKDRLLWQLSNEEFWEDRYKVLKFASDYKELIEDCVNAVLQTDARIIGFSVFNSSKEFSLLMAEKIKERAKDKIIILGGPHCFPHMQGLQIIQDESVDLMAIGEGEVTLDELVSQVDSAGRVSFCEGAWFKENGKVIDCGNRALISDLNKLPFADFIDFALESYSEPNRLPIYLSRGCPNRCIYCNENIFWRGYRFRSGKRVLEEIKYQLNRHRQVVHFDFADQLVNGNPKELSQLADLIIKEGLKITWAGQAIIRSYMTPELLNKLKQSGCVCLAYGIESGSQKVLDLMKKGFTVKDAQCVIRDTHNAGIDAVSNFMFGFPGETDGDFKQTLDFIYKNKEYISTVNPSRAYTAIGVGSYLYEHADEFNIDLSGGHLFWKTKGGDNTYETRQKRYEAFCNLAASLGIKFSFTVNINKNN
jgi:anaerobic magnesium-protoporphyrin IX monomethyl ester cyclase